MNLFQKIYKKLDSDRTRMSVVAWFLGFFAVAIVLRLFTLQILWHEEAVAMAEMQQKTTNVDPANRGSIFIKSNKTGDHTLLAENLTLYLLYVDPNAYMEEEMDGLVNRSFIADKLAPLLYLHFCGEGAIANDSSDSCDTQVSEFTRVEETEWSLFDEVDREDKMKEAIATAILNTIIEQEVVFVPLQYTNNTAELENAKTAFEGLNGVVVGEGIIYANPKDILRDSNGTPAASYGVVAETMGLEWDQFVTMMTRRLSRYSFLVRRVTPELRALIEDLKRQEKLCPQLYKDPTKVDGLIDQNTDICQNMRQTAKGRYVKNFHTVALREENWRHYPEDTIASQLAGFLNFEGEGNYGVEEEFDTLLRGNDGKMTLESDPMGRLIASNLQADQIQEKRDGVDVYLTIDRVVQRYVEDKLRDQVRSVKANSGQAIVMNPYTGDIIAMAQYPNFNPNFYTEAYEMTETYLDPGKGLPMYIRGEDGELINIPDYDRGTIGTGTTRYVYKNKVGAGAFYNHAVQQPYEPGSIFKPLIVAAGIDAGEITPSTTYTDRGELKVDEFTIRNVSEKCLGTHDMVNVLNWSCNIGMSFIAQKMGKALMHKYITDFGFGERTDVELPNEAKGLIYPFEEWSNARLFNAAFGQGLTVTPLQMAQSYSILANGGLLINPKIVDRVVYNPGTSEEHTEVIKEKYQNRVVSKETADTVSAMLTQVVEKGGSKVTQLEGYFVAGKTGTAQIASSRGGYEDDPVGSTVGSFAGYLPSDRDEPRFVVITKIDRPRTTKWADQSAAPLFKEIAAFLVKYYNIPPNR